MTLYTFAPSAESIRADYLETILGLTIYSAGPKKKEQQKMSLGAFMTDESKLPMKMQAHHSANALQSLDPGPMRWRICQFVSIITLNGPFCFCLLIVPSRYD